MGSRDRRKRQAKKIANSLVVWFGNKPYVWSRKYGTFINWFRLKTGEIRGEKLEDAKRRNNEQAAQEVGRWVDEDNDENPIRIGPSNLSEEAKVHNELVEEMRILPRLRAEGRTILPDRKGVAHRDVYNEDDLPKFGDVPFQTIDFVDGKNIKKRRFFGANRELVQEIHYIHGDPAGTHIFPHIHIIFGNDWSFPIQCCDEKNVRYYKMTNPMGDRFKNVTEAEVNALARHCDKRIEWRKKNGITDETINRIVCNRDRRAAISTVRAVQILLSYGHELEVEYDGYSGLVYPYMAYYYVALEKDDKKYIYTTSDLDDFGQNAKFGPYSLKDVVDKWDVHFA